MKHIHYPLRSIVECRRRSGNDEVICSSRASLLGVHLRRCLHLVAPHSLGPIEGNVRFSKQLLRAPCYPGDHGSGTDTDGNYRTYR
jgi:hypothetical protein